MKYLALAVFFAVVQASPPVPRQAAGSSAGASDSVQRDAHSEKEALAKGSPSGQPPSHDAVGTEQGTKNAEHSISVSKLPPVTIASPKRDWADWGVWVFTFLLAATSVLQIWLLRRTLTYVRRQAHEMRHQRHEMWRQRKALGKQAELMAGQLTEMQESRKIENRTLILQYRPKLIVRNAKALQFSYELGQPWECEFQFTVVNTGGSPAHIGVGTKVVLMSCVAHDVGNIDLKDGDTFWLKKPFSLQPGEEVIIQESLPTGATFDVGWENFRLGIETEPRRYLYLFSQIHYSDDLSIPRSTGVNRRYDAKTRTFVAKKDEEQEYAD